MGRLVIIGTMKVRPGIRDKTLGALLPHRERCLRGEPGTLQFVVLVPHDQEDTVMFYDVYLDAAAFDAHWNGASVARVRAEAADLIVGLTGIKCVNAARSCRVGRSTGCVIR